MAMISTLSHSQALRAMDIPSNLYFASQGLSRGRVVDLLLVESDNEWWFNPDSATKHFKLDGLTEAEVNVKLCTGYTHCPKCSAAFARESALATPLAAYAHFAQGVDARVGFYDFFVDDTVRIQEQFACKKCRHQWGGKCSGQKDAAIVGVSAPSRAPSAERGPSGPRAAAVPGQLAVHYQLFKTLQKEIPHSDWDHFRPEFLKRCAAAGIKPGTATAAASKGRKLFPEGEPV